VANDRRGEVDAEVGGQTHRLKLTLNDIEGLERSAGMGWQTFVKRALQSDLFIGDIVALWRAGCAGATGKMPKDADVRAMIDEHGPAAFTTPIRRLVLLQAIGAKAASEMEGGREGSKGTESTGTD